MFAARTASLTSQGADLIPQMKFHYHFGDKAIDNTLNGNIADSGHTVVSNPGPDPEAVGQIIASPIDGFHVYTTLDTQADTSYNHLLTPDMGGRVVYQKVKFRFGSGGSTNYQVLAVVAWENWPANNSTTASPAHILFAPGSTVCQTYANLAASTTLTHTYSSPYTTEWQEATIAIDPIAGAVVVQCPDGAVVSYETPTASSLTNYSTADFEIGLIAPNTDNKVEVLSIASATTSGMSPDVAKAYDSLLASRGYGSAYVAPSGVVLQASTNIDSGGNSMASPASASATHPGGSGSNLAALVWVQVSSTVSGGMLSGHTRSATYGGQAMTSLGAVLVNNETDVPAYWLETWGLLNAPAGSQTVSVQYSKTGETYRLTCVAETFAHVASFGTPVVEYGTANGTTETLVVNSAPNNMVAHGFIAESAGSFSGYTYTVIRNQAQGTNRTPFLVGTAAGTSPSISSTVTRATNNSDYAHIGINLVSS